jgi:hypothetical protein
LRSSFPALSPSSRLSVDEDVALFFAVVLIPPHTCIRMQSICHQSSSSERRNKGLEADTIRQEGAEEENFSFKLCLALYFYDSVTLLIIIMPKVMPHTPYDILACQLLRSSYTSTNKDVVSRRKVLENKSINSTCYRSLIHR